MNDTLLEELINIVEKHGIKGIFGVLLVYTIISVIKSQWVGNLFTKLSDKFVERFMKSETKDVSIRKINDSDIKIITLILHFN